MTRAHAGLQVDKVNEQRLKDLVDASGNPEPSRFFQAVDEGQSPYLEQIKKNCLAPFTLELKKGAQARPRPAPRAPPRRRRHVLSLSSRTGTHLSEGC